MADTLKRGPDSATLPWLFFFVVVNGYGIEIFGFEHLVAIQTSDVIYTVSPVKKLGSLVLTGLHSEITPILDRELPLSSAVGGLRVLVSCG